MTNLFFPKEKWTSIYIYTIIILIISVLCFTLFYKYEEYTNYYGQVNNDYLVILVEKENIKNITNRLLVNDKQRNCKISKISTNYILNTDNKLYHEIYYECDLNRDELINGYILDIKMNIGNTTLFEKIKNSF